ncbi:MAG: hypothetical protein LBD23_20380, partial [Oscillospiraceae bacterium]|nr:hypothetical protein [Oscillospiraceae bacterium]
MPFLSNFPRIEPSDSISLTSTIINFLTIPCMISFACSYECCFVVFQKCSIAHNVQGIRRFDGISRTTVPHDRKPSKCGGAKPRLTLLIST